MKKAYSFVLLACLLAACSTNEETLTQTTTTDSAVESSSDEVTLSNEEATQIVESVIINLGDATYPSQVGEYDFTLNTDDFTEAEWDEIHALKMKNLQQYATDAFIASNIYLDDESCEPECHTQISMDLYFAWEPSIQIISPTEFQSLALFPPASVVKDGDFDSYEQVVHFILQDNQWKIKQLDFNKRDISLALEDMKEFLAKQAFINITTNQTEEMYELNGQMEKAYPFIDNDMEMEYVVLARTGYVTLKGGGEDLDDYEETDYDYSINNAEDYLVYNLFYDWSSLVEDVDQSSPEVVQFLQQLAQFEENRTAAYTAQDEEQLTTIVEGIINISSDMYDFYSAEWDENQLLNYESVGRAWFQDFMYYFDEVVAADTSTLERLNDEALIRLSDAYSLIVTEGY